MFINLNEVILKNEMAIRLGFFFGIFAVMALWELISPRRQLQTSKVIRWINNLGLVFFNSFVLRLVFPAAAVGMAVFASEQGRGWFNYIDAPFWVAVVTSVVVMDFFIWLQHVMVHAVPVLWRLHRVHHADLDFDVTTGARFHPLEILLSMLIKFAVIVLLGPPVLAVVLFEVILNATSMFNHGNVRLPETMDQILRLIVVTPDMHRVHHSAEDDETNSNFGFNLPWWDRLFGTYRAQPRAGHAAMTIGIHTFREDRWCSWLPGMLAIPFVGKVQDYAINRRQWGLSMNNNHLMRIMLFVGLLAAVTLAIMYRHQLDGAALETWVREAGPVAPLLFMLIYALAAVLFLPGSVLTLAGGALFGPVLGTFYNLTGATLGATLAFLITRYLASDWVAEKTGGRVKQLINGVEGEGWRFIRPVNIFVVDDRFAAPIDTTQTTLVLGKLSARECSICHQAFYDEWRTTIHSKAWTDPYFQIYWEFDDARYICRLCHTPLDRQLPHTVLGYNDKDKWDPILADNPDFDPELQHEGVTCAACHYREGKIVGVLGDTNAPHPVIKLEDPNQICVRCHIVEGKRWDTFFRFLPCGTVAEIESTLAAFPDK